MLELADEEKEKTLTLRRDRSIAKDQKKLDEMKRKLHTDDERKSIIIIIPYNYILYVHNLFFTTSEILGNCFVLWFEKMQRAVNERK